MKIIIPVFLFLIIGCKTQEIENPPSVLTLDVSEISLRNAKISGEVTNEGNSATLDRGFVFSDKIITPSISDTRIQSGYGKGGYSINLENLTVNTPYYYKAYATNSKGTSYGNVKSFTTADFKLATSTTEIPKNITYTTIDLFGSITDNGGGNVIENGFIIGINAIPVTSDIKLPVSKGLGEISLNFKNVNTLKLNTKYYIHTYAINEKGISYGNEQSFTTLQVTSVTSKTGKIWMDRNLGASQVATSPSDEKSFGDLYQWGREADGHQLRNSETTTITSARDSPGNSKFILTDIVAPVDWRVPQNDNLWQPTLIGSVSVNNVCPNGYRLPIISELLEEAKTWTSQNSEGAFNSVLKLPTAGYRSSYFKSNGKIFYGDGPLPEAGYWSSTVALNHSYILIFGNSVSMGLDWRGYGRTVRCIQGR